MNVTKSIIVNCTDILQDSNFDSELTSQALYGEKVLTLETNDKLTKIQLLTDNYIGWVDSSSLGDLAKPNYRVLKPRIFLYSKPDIKSKVFTFLSIGSQINAHQYSDDWLKLKFKKKNIILDLFVLKIDVVETDHKVKDWLITAKTLLNTPYLWGGRSSLGLDCSALIQISLQSIGKSMPRDTFLQKEKNDDISNSSKTFDKGCIIFWDGHVGVMINEKDFLHANAFHMTTVIEPIKNVLYRSRKINSEITKVIKI